MELKELRTLMESAEPRLIHINDNNNVLDETFLESCFTPLDEAFFGKNPIQPIQKAMDSIYDLVAKNPKTNVTKTPENKMLEAAIQKVFNFKSVSIEWSNSSIGGTSVLGPATAYTFYPNKFKTITDQIRYGNYLKKDGYQDVGKLKIYITMDVALFTECGLTSEEGTAILLHEIGHNMDLSLMTVLGCWVSILFGFFDILMSIPKGKLRKTIFNKTVAELGSIFGRGVVQKITNLNAYIMDTLPPLTVVGSGLYKININLKRFFVKFFSPVSTITIPVIFLLMPFSYIISIFSRSRERFADTFAASYGYGEEFISGNEKMSQYPVFDPEKDPKKGNAYTNVFGGLALFYRELLVMMGPHQTNQTRLIKIIDKLESDLSTITNPELKKDVQEEINQCKKLYDDIVNLPDDERIPFLTAFRQMMDKWYNGKSYLVLDIDQDFSYA